MRMVYPRGVIVVVGFGGKDEGSYAMHANGWRVKPTYHSNAKG
jgi:hypothetical protein